MKLGKILSGTVVAVGMILGSAANAATVDLGFALDASGSVGATNFATTRNGLAAALDLIPTSGVNDYRIAVYSYASSPVQVVPPTVVTAANIAAIKTAVQNTTYTGGGTGTASVIAAMTAAFVGVGLGDTTLFNISTDGRPNSQAATQTAALAAHAAGVDGLSFEAIGRGTVSTSLQNAMLSIAFPGTPVLVTDLSAIPDATTTGFVIPVNGFAAYEAAIGAKVQSIVDNTGGGPSVVPLPAGLPLLLAGLGAFGILRRKSAI